MRVQASDERIAIDIHGNNRAHHQHRQPAANGALPRLAGRNRWSQLVAEAEKYDIVFQEAVYASKRIDITDKVLKELSK
jgi:hypothetical protein